MTYTAVKTNSSQSSYRKRLLSGATAALMAFGAIVGFAAPASADNVINAGPYDTAVAAVYNAEQNKADYTPESYALFEDGIEFVNLNLDNTATQAELDEATATINTALALLVGKLAPTIATAKITGTATVGQVLTAEPTGVTGTPTPTLSYQWKVSVNGGPSENIEDATSATFTLKSAQLGAVITVVVTADNATSPAASATSTGTAAVAAAPVVGVAPTIATAKITGTATVGQVLTAEPTGVTGTPTPTLSYQWKVSVNGGPSENIEDATSATFTLKSAQLGAVITVVVTADNATSPAASATSTGTAAVAAAPVVSPPAPSAGGGTIIESPRPAPVATPVSTPVQKPTSAFAANSSKLSKDLRASIRATLDSKLDAKYATCRAFVGSSNATAAEKKLARDRSKAACAFIAKSNPNLDVKVVKINLVAKTANQLRKVRLVLR